MSTNRGGNKPARDKAAKTNHIQNGKTEPASIGNKNQPTAEQLRIAQLTSSDSEPTDISKKALQIAELTNRTKDEAYTALHDCDYDVNRAVEILLEKQGDQAEEWQEISKKKKTPVGGKGSQVGSGENTVDTGPSSRNVESVTPVEQDRERGGEGSQRGRRERGGPPRFQRGRGYGSANGEKGGSTSRERPGFDREQRQGFEPRQGFDQRQGFEPQSQGRGGGGGYRGRRGGNSNAVGGGRSYAGRGFSTGRTGFETGPQIDTWTNEKTVNGEKEEWGTEDWTADEWSGSLQESRVFTASTSLASNATAYDTNASSATVAAATTAASSFYDPTTLSSQVYVASSTASAAAASRTGPSTAAADGVASLMTDVGASNVYRSATMQPSSISAHDTAVTSELIEQYVMSNPDLSTAYLSRYSKEATEVIKNAVGIGNSGMGGHGGLTMDQLNMSTSQSSMQNCAAASVVKQQQQQQRPRLPPPSKIPASAVEMPASMNSAQLDVQFGNWDSTPAASANDNSLSFMAGDIGAQSHYAPASHSMPSQQQTPAMHGGAGMSGFDMAASRSAMMSSVAPGNDAANKSALLTLDELGIGTGGGGSVSKSTAASGYQNAGAGVTKDFVNSKLQMQPGQQSAVSFPPSQPDRKVAGVYQSQSQPAATSQPTSHPSMSSQLPPFSQVGSLYPGSGTESAAASSVYKQATTAASPAPSAFNTQQMNQYGSSSFSAYSADGSTGQFTTYSGTAAPGFGPQPQVGTGSYGSTQGPGAAGFPAKSSYNAAISATTVAATFPTTGHSQNVYDIGNTYQQLGAGSASGQLTGGSGYQQAAGYQGQLSYQAVVSYPSAAAGYESSGQMAGAGVYGSTGGHSAFSQNLYATRQGRESSGVPASGGYPSASADVSGGSYVQRGVGQGGFSVGGQQPATTSTGVASAGSTAGGKLSDSIGKLSVKDTTGSQPAGQYDTSASASSVAATPASLSTATSTTSSAGVGLLPAAAATSAAARTTPSTATTTKSMTPATSKTMVNMPVGNPAAVMNNYMIAQPPGFQLATFGYPAAQQQMTYTFEDIQMLQQQQRFPMTPYYESFQPSTTMTSRDASSIAAQNYATGADANKLPIDPMSPVTLQPAQPQPTISAQPGSANAQQQSYMNPAAMHPAAAPSYSYYYPGAAGIMPVGSYYAPMIPMGGMQAVPLATNPAHGVTTATTQYQKAAIYGSHAGYNVGGQTQDFSKTFGASQTSNKGPVAAGSVGASSDVMTGGTAFGKNHVQTYDKSGFHSGTPPPPFNMAMPSAAQSGAALGQGYGTPYMPMMQQHQSHSQILHHPMSQDAALAGRSSMPQNAGQQPKTGGNVNKNTGAYGSGYWGAN